MSKMFHKLDHWMGLVVVNLLLRRFEFESEWRHQFFSVKFVFEKNKDKQKRPGLAHLKN